MPWFEVIADEFNYQKKRSPSISVAHFPKGGPYLGTEDMVAAGEEAGQVKRVNKPKDEKSEEVKDERPKRANKDGGAAKSD